MRRALLLSLLVTLAAALVALPASAAHHAIVNPQTKAGRLQAALDRALAKYKVPGAVVGVWTPAGRWTSATGLADVRAGRKVLLGDRFAIRSITKSYVVTMILQLEASGKLSLDDPVSRYVDGVPDGDRITLRELANMTSGLFNYTSDKTFLQALSADLARPWTTPQLLQFAFGHPVNFAPGAAYEYSNTNTLVLGEVVEKVTGKPWAQALQEMILDPLRLGSTLYRPGTEIPPPSVKGYVPGENGKPEEVAINSSGLGAAGGLASTLADLKRWGEALAEGTLLPADLQRERFVARKATNGPEYDRYGLGIGEIGGWWGHTGNALGFEACVFHQIKRNETIAILLNGSETDPDIPAHLFRKLVTILGS